jgi:hypothetical protein
MDMEEYWTSVESILNDYPHFRSQIPKYWPRNIKEKQVIEYQQHRTDIFWEHLNLPTLIFSYKNLNDEVTCKLYKTILDDLESFSTEMIHLPQAHNTLCPLWDNAWNVKDNPFWSVLSEIKLAKLLLKNNWTIEGFHQQIVTSTKKADIKARKGAAIFYIDIEASSLTKVIKGSEDDFRRFVVKRTLKKIEKKFQYIPDNEYGVVAMVFRPKDADMKRFSYKTWTLNKVESGKVNVWGSIYWLATEREPEISLLLVDNTLAAEIL